MAEHQTILVTGATGQQGGSVVRHLRDAGFIVRAITRDPRSDKAKSLSKQGVALVRCDLTDRATIDPALDGVDGVFAMATPFEHGTEAEVVQGTLLGDAARDRSIRHYVYSSVGAAERQTGIPHFESKWLIEQHLRSLRLPLTVIRPTWFFENLPSYSMRPQGGGHAVMMPLSPARPLQGMAVDDVGAFVALAFSSPDKWLGRELELAGDERTGPQYAAAIAKDLGVPVSYQQIPWEAVREQSEDLYRMYDYFEREGYQADIRALRAEYPALKTFDQWLLEGGLSRLRTAA